MKKLSSITVRVDSCEWAEGHVRCIIHTVFDSGGDFGSHRFDETTFPRNDFIPFFERAMNDISRRIKALFVEEEKKKNT